MYDVKSAEDLVAEYDATLDYLDFKTHDGFVFSINGQNHIVIDSKLDICERRFAMAHEVWHIVDKTVWAKYNKYAEQKASDIAIHLLVSDKQIQDALDDWHRDIPTLSSIFWMPYKWMEERITQFKKKYNLE